jgi:hypothetical protein
MNQLQLFVHKRLISAVERVEFLSDRLSHWLIVILNIHAPTEDNIDDVKDGTGEELECVFDKFPKHHTNFF